MPLVPPLALMSLTRKNLGHVCPCSPKILGTSLKSGRFYITEGVGASAPCPPRASMSLTRKSFVHLYSKKIICWLHHCNQQLRELRNNWHLRATLHQVFVTSNISTVTHSIVARIVCHAEVICFAKKPSCRKSFVFVNES